MELYKDWYCVTFDAKVGAVTKAELGQTRKVEKEFVFLNYNPEETGQIPLF